MVGVMDTAIAPLTTLADLVNAHPDLARELERRSLDYCCGGSRTLAEACSLEGLDLETVVGDLAAAASAPPAPWSGLGAAELVDHLESTHHAYLHAELPRIAALAAKVRSVHGSNHPELAGLERTFTDLRNELDPHLAKEEQVLFPMIRQLAAEAQPPEPSGGGVRNPISVMLREHDHAGQLLGHLRHLTGGYTVPAGGCASYHSLYRALDELESDTHLHVHIENNRLFPMVVELEANVSEATPSGTG
jgi:regulator of cell morphogenesis and NO signaling